MTGYGKADATYNGKKIHVEIKSLNSKALDLSTRLAPLYREKEMELRKLIQDNLERGKVDFNLWIEKDATAVGGVINADAVANEIAANLQALVGTTEESEPKAEPKHPSTETTTSKFANLQFGRNYDPTQR